MIEPSPDIRRRPPSRHQRRSILIVHDTHGLFPDYLHWLKSVLDHHQMPSAVVQADDDLLTRVERAAQQVEDAAIKGSAFEEVWCVADHTGPVPAATRELARKAEVDLALSTPSINLWFLLHFVDRPRMETPTGIDRELADHLERTGSSIRGGVLAGRFDTATRRATRLASAGIDSPMPLNTNVFEMVGSLRDSLKAHSGMQSIPPL